MFGRDAMSHCGAHRVNVILNPGVDGFRFFFAKPLNRCFALATLWSSIFSHTIYSGNLGLFIFGVLKQFPECTEWRRSCSAHLFSATVSPNAGTIFGTVVVLAAVRSVL